MNELSKYRQSEESAWKLLEAESQATKRLREQVAAQAAVIYRLREALEYYANQCNYCNCDECEQLRYEFGSETQHAIFALAIPTDSTQILDEVRRAERDTLKSKIDRVKYIMASKAYKDGATLSVEICVLDDEAVGDFSERICWFVDRAMG